MGGPIKRDKLFFVVGEEWKRLRQLQSPTQQTVPTSAELNGDFSALPNVHLFFPGTTNPIPGNVIPQGLITQQGRAIAVYRSQQLQAGPFIDQPVSNKITLQPSNPLNFREDLVRLDYHLSDRHTVYGRWIQDDNQLIDPFGTFSCANLPVVPTNRMRPGESFLIAHTFLINANTINEARANASWASQNIPPYGDSWLRSTYGFTYPQLYGGGNYDAGIPSVNVTGFANLRSPSFALHSPSTDIQFADTVSVILGPHVIKAGGTVIRDRVDQWSG